VKKDRIKAKNLITLASEMGKRNLFVIIIIPLINEGNESADYVLISLKSYFILLSLNFWFYFNYYSFYFILLSLNF
jgi:hypothetical protein